MAAQASILTATPSLAQNNNSPVPPVNRAEEVFKDRASADTASVLSATRENPVRAYRIATVRDPDDPGHFSDKNRALVIPQAILSLQDFLDRNIGKDPGAELLHIRTLNDLHEFSPAIRFETLEKLKARGVFQLMTKGRPEIYTSSYIALYDDFVTKLRKEGQPFSRFLEADRRRANYIPAFLDGVSSFGRMKDFLSRIGSQEKNLLISTVTEGIAADRMNVIAAANMIKEIGANDPAVKTFEEEILKGFTQAENLKTRNAYGVLASWYETSVRPLGLSTQAQYALPDFSRLDTAQLYDAKGRNYQLHMFYNDEDGRANYALFKERSAQNGWDIRENVNSGITRFEKRNGTRKISILTTNPYSSRDEKAIAADIRQIVLSEGGTISVAVHRGHSYSVNDTINKMYPEVKLAFLGSCGGSQYIQSTLGRAASAQIIATASVGKRTINQNLIEELENSILSGGIIDWQSFENKLARNPDLEARYYMMPSQNLAARILSKLREMDLKAPQLAASPAQVATMMP